MSENVTGWRVLLDTRVAIPMYRVIELVVRLRSGRNYKVVFVGNLLPKNIASLERFLALRLVYF